MNSRRILISSAAVLVLAALSLVVWRSQRPHGLLAAMVRVDAESAIACLHDSEDGARTRGWLALVGRSGTVSWAQALPGLPLGPERGGLGLGGGIVTIQTERSEVGRPAAVVTQGYDAATGELRWEVEQPNEDARHTAHIVSNDQLLLSLEPLLGLTARDRRSGAVRWGASFEGLDPVGAGIRLSARHAVVESADGVDFFALSDGAHTHVDTRGGAATSARATSPSCGEATRA